MSAKAQVIIETDMDKLAGDLIQNCKDGVVAAWEDGMVPFAEKVRQLWPRRTGYSAGRLQGEVKFLGDRVLMRIFDDADYARFIVIKKWGSKNAAKTLLYDPADALADRLIEIIGDELVGEF